MSTMYLTVSRDSLMRRRAEILSDLGLTLTRFRRNLRTGQLTPREWDVREEFVEIEFLLGEER